MIGFRPLRDQEFSHLREASVDSMAVSLSLGRDLPMEKIREVCKAQVNRELEAARKSDQHHFLAILAGDSDEPVGSLWYKTHKEASSADMVFLVWFGIYDQYQSKGYGEVALNLLSDQLRSEGFARLGLDVFDRNTPAWKLYISCGFEPTRTVMHKRL